MTKREIEAGFVTHPGSAAPSAGAATGTRRRHATDINPPIAGKCQPGAVETAYVGVACQDCRCMDGEGPRFGAMIALVAIVVATVILVFFGIGYALGRLFL